MKYLARNENQIGQVIRRTRKQQGISQAELGEKCGLRQATISLIESGNPAMKIQTLLSVLVALDLELTIGPREKISNIENIF